MVIRRQDRTTLLPQALREKLHEHEPEAQLPGSIHKHVSFRSKHVSGSSSRRARRGQEKIAKQMRKAQYYARRHDGDFSQREDSAKESTKRVKDERPPKRRKIDIMGTNLLHPAHTEVKSTSSKDEDPSLRKRMTSMTRRKTHPPNGQGSSSQKALEPPVSVSRKGSDEVKSKMTKIRLAVEEDEDREIAWLEYQLGFGLKEKKESARKESGYRRLLKEDGLDDLFDSLDNVMADIGDDASDDDGAQVDEDNDEDEDGNEDNSSIATGDEEHMEEDDEEGEASDRTDAKMESSIEGNSNVLLADDPQAVAQPPSQAGSKYIPPHLRQVASTTDANIIRLSRQLKGLVNRLSEQNIRGIISDLEGIYRENARQGVTSNLVSIVIESISSNASLLDSHVALSATLVAALYRVVGVEFAACFIQEVVKAYEVAYTNAASQVQDASDANAGLVGKDAQNLLVCISELYNLQVISCILVYDVVRTLLHHTMGELEVELLLKILRLSGRQLRQDDPSALKDIVQLVTDNVSRRRSKELSSRTRFMVETLTNLKSNRTKREDSNSAENVERTKKMLGGLSKKHSGSCEPLRVTLRDLQTVDSKGKWWLVGAGWAGDPLADIQQSRKDIAPGVTKSKPGKGGESKEDTESQRLLALAKKQGMNTDIRRSVFVVLMSSDDYVDACDRVSQLSLTEQQQREIVRVLFHCCGNEKVYNPYYALVGQRLLDGSHAHRITAQFCLWDFLRSLGETGLGQREGESFDASSTSVSPSRIRNVAKLCGWLIARGSLSIAALRPIDFAHLQHATQSFLDTMLCDLFINTQTSTPILSRAGLATLWQRGRGGGPNAIRKTQGIAVFNGSQLVQTFMPATRDPGLRLMLVGYLDRFLKRKVDTLVDGEEHGEQTFFEWAVDAARSVLDRDDTSATVRQEMDWEE